MINLIFFLSVASLCTTSLILLKLFQMERDMERAKLHNQVTQEIPLRRRTIRG